jgi:hypothetical protein
MQLQSTSDGGSDFVAALSAQAFHFKILETKKECASLLKISFQAPVDILTV